MMNAWTKEDIEAILIQLNNQNLPFKKVSFLALGEGMVLLGTGASANVYEAVSKEGKAKAFAIKVIGFSSKHVESDAFRNAVKAQKKLGSEGDNVVRIYDSTELRVWIEGEHEVVKAEEINPYEDTRPEGNYLHLQFVLMEKISPVLEKYRTRRKLISEKLEAVDEAEVLKLAYGIGMAINHAHKANLIHRDIKLENIFYDAERQQYKLGDFGIAKMTDDGMASTVAFTKGYGAPEVVGTLEDKYDCTADIYSFGMLLYVLLNEMCFPESADYRPKVDQYRQGYIPPEPINGSDELVRIVLKMLCFNPDDRYQTMEEVLNELDGINYGKRIKYQREHANITLALGTVLALAGAAIWKLTFMTDTAFDFSVWMYLFCGLCIGKSIPALFRKKNKLLHITSFVAGCFLLFQGPFSGWKFVLFLLMISGQYWTGIVCGSALAANFSYLLLKTEVLSAGTFAEYRWVTVLLLSVAAELLFLRFLQAERDDQLVKMYLRKNLFWILTAAIDLELIMMAYSMRMRPDAPFDVLLKLLPQNVTAWIFTWNPGLVGICGLTFCVVWVMRERILMSVENGLAKENQSPLAQRDI